LVPYIKSADELKTKPTQHSVKELREIGIQPDILLCRTEIPLPQELKSKIALFCNVSEEAVITAKDVDTIYEVPLALHQEALDEIIVRLLQLPSHEPDLSEWERIVEKIKWPSATTKIAIVGKYINLRDSYKSLSEALLHGGIGNNAEVVLQWVDSEEIEAKGPEALLAGMNGILIPGGFGDRGIEGKIAAIKYAREKEIPFFGICLGMQCAVIEFARNVCNIKEANSSEFDPESTQPVIDLHPEQLGDKEKYGTQLRLKLETRQKKPPYQLRGGDKGGTMRLGAYKCKLEEGSFARRIYQTADIRERHRHRFEVNNHYRNTLLKHGLKVSGLSPDGRLVEIIELVNHPWFLGVQFHPEFNSSPKNPHPLFKSFIEASLKCKAQEGQKESDVRVSPQLIEKN
jgi:CTP synthase